MRFAAMVLILALAGCSSIKVERLNRENPSGLPFYLIKPMVKVTTIEYTFYSLSQNKEIGKVRAVDKEIVTVPDTSAAYTVNHQRAFAGETKFKLERSNSYDISKIETENKEGITEFLKGLVEGAKTISEIAKEAEKAKAAPAGVITSDEATYFNALAQKDVAVFKSVINVSFEELK